MYSRAMYHKLYSTMRLILRPSTARPLHVTRPSPSLDPISLPSWWPLITQTKASSAAHIVSSHEWHWSAESDADEVKHSVTFTAEASSDSGSDGKGRWKCRVTLVGPGEGEQLISEATAGSYAEAREKAEFKLREMIKAQEKKNTSDAEGDEMK